MLSFLESFESVESFFRTGGVVLYAIAFVGFIMWTLLIERAFFIVFNYKKERKNAIALYKHTAKKDSCLQYFLTKMFLSQLKIKLEKYTHILKALIAICPMLGLLGTVLGMIEVFDVVSMVGTGNAKAMADGVSKATIPTMSGMVVALSGIFFLFWYQRKIIKEELRLMEKFEGVL